jgi:hypothetical protein
MVVGPNGTGKVRKKKELILTQHDEENTGIRIARLSFKDHLLIY